MAGLDGERPHVNATAQFSQNYFRFCFRVFRTHHDLEQPYFWRNTGRDGNRDPERLIFPWPNTCRLLGELGIRHHAWEIVHTIFFGLLRIFLVRLGKPVLFEPRKPLLQSFFLPGAFWKFGRLLDSSAQRVICGRASARSMDPASATLESPLDSSKHIIAQLLCPVQRSPMQGFQLSALSINPGSERYCLVSPLTECRVGTIKAG